MLADNVPIPMWDTHSTGCRPAVDSAVASADLTLYFQSCTCIGLRIQTAKSLENIDVTIVRRPVSLTVKILQSIDSQNH